MLSIILNLLDFMRKNKKYCLRFQKSDLLSLLSERLTVILSKWPFKNILKETVVEFCSSLEMKMIDETNK